VILVKIGDIGHFNTMNRREEGIVQQRGTSNIQKMVIFMIRYYCADK
jgi:hypothetical protein